MYASLRADAWALVLAALGDNVTRQIDISTEDDGNYLANLQYASTYLGLRESVPIVYDADLSLYLVGRGQIKIIGPGQYSEADDKVIGNNTTRGVSAMEDLSNIMDIVAYLTDSSLFLDIGIADRYFDEEDNNDTYRLV